jgi:hypothetical protein
MFSLRSTLSEWKYIFYFMYNCDSVVHHALDGCIVVLEMLHVMNRLDSALHRKEFPRQIFAISNDLFSSHQVSSSREVCTSRQIQELQEGFLSHRYDLSPAIFAASCTYSAINSFLLARSRALNFLSYFSLVCRTFIIFAPTFTSF